MRKIHKSNSWQIEEEAIQTLLWGSSPQADLQHPVEKSCGYYLPPKGQQGALAGNTVVWETWKGSALNGLFRGLCGRNNQEVRSGTDNMLALAVHSSHTRAGLATIGAHRPWLQHMPRGCFLKMALDLQYSLAKPGIDVGSQRTEKLMVQQSTKDGYKNLGGEGKK